MEKDLANARALAAKLEGVAAELRKVKMVGPKAPAPGEGAVPDGAGDVAMPTEEEEEPEPRERGCDAVERRIEKVMADLRAQELVDVNDDKAYEAKKVCIHLPVLLKIKLTCGRLWFRLTCTLRICARRSTRATTVRL